MDTDQYKEGMYIVTVNAGSSSIKFAVFVRDTLQKELEVAVENIGKPSSRIVLNKEESTFVQIATYEAAVDLFIQQLNASGFTQKIEAIGHRIVHGGMDYYMPTIATEMVLKKLHALEPFDPEHLPIELQLVTIFQNSMPEAKQILCFDTAFHHNLPIKAKLLPIPRSLSESGIYKYGFHGLSYSYIVDALAQVEGEEASHGKVIIAHLGSGASMAALYQGKSIDTTMSMTPASGIPMSTRSGDLDPGLFLYLHKTKGYSIEEINKMVNFASGLLGISQTTADMEQLLQIADNDIRAKDAIDIFCYQIKKTIGSFAAALGGLHTLVFTGGIGERAPKIREQICEGLDFLGVVLDGMRNKNSERLISADESPVGVHVIHTDEAVTIAREIKNILYEQS